MTFRKADHRAYAVACPLCGAERWRACAEGGKALSGPHPERVQAELAVKTTSKQRTPDLFDDHHEVEEVDGEVSVRVFNDDGSYNLEGLARAGNLVNRRGGRSK